MSSEENKVNSGLHALGEYGILSGRLDGREWGMPSSARERFACFSPFRSLGQGQAVHQVLSVQSA